MNTAGSYRADIDGLRALAIIPVVLFHANFGPFSGGYTGVDVFFVISGFLISSIIFSGLESGNFTFRGFYARRIRRIFPGLVLVLSFCLVAGWFELLDFEYEALGKHIAGGAAFVANFVVMQESGYFAGDSYTKPLIHLWSLGIEEQFYLVWPAFVYLLWKLRLNMLVATVLIIATSFALNVRITGVNPDEAFYSPVSRFWELMVGSSLAYISIFPKDADTTGGTSFTSLMGRVPAWLATQAGRAGSRDLLSMLGFLLVIGSVLMLDQGKAFPGWWALLPTAGTALMLSAGAQAWLNRTVLSSRVLVWFGLISYPLYLWHWPLLSLANILGSTFPSAGVRAAAVLASIALAWLTYRFIERPIRFGQQRGVAVAGLCILMAAAGILGYQAYDSAGWGFRAANTTNRLADPDALKQYRAERQRTIRSPYCHLNKPEQTFAEYESGISECLKLSSRKKNVLVVGDSYAADLWVALSRGYPGINFLQATGAQCTPYNVDSTGRCFQLTEYAIWFAQSSSLDAVVLAGAWNRMERLDQRHFLRMVSVVERLQPKTRVILAGPPVEFTATVPALLGRRPAAEDLNTYFMRFIRKDKIPASRALMDFAERRNIPYIDRIREFCGPQLECPVSDGGRKLYIVDVAHLTLPGAIFFGNKLRRNGVLERAMGDIPAGATVTGAVLDESSS